MVRKHSLAGLLPRFLSTAALLSLCGCVMTMTDSIPALPEDLHAPVVAVTSFENRSGFAGQWQLGSGMADLLVSELVHSRNFTVVERQHFGSYERSIEPICDGEYQECCYYKC